MVEIIDKVEIDGNIVKLQDALCRIRTSEGQTVTITENEADDLCTELKSVLLEEYRDQKGKFILIRA